VSDVDHVRLPRVVAQGDARCPGWIEFGPPIPSLPSLPHAVHRLLRKVRPAEGTMLLFPSYICHWTIPLDSDEERLSIAFDMI
jgi:hypothetical protein